MAVKGLGWKPVFFSEIEPFPCALLKHRYPDVPNLGNMLHFKQWPERCDCKESDQNPIVFHLREFTIADKKIKIYVCLRCGGIRIDVLIAGTPCQSFSVAGLRKGLDDPRGNLSLVFLAILDRYRPTWVAWENVPGILSHPDKPYETLLAGFAELGYSTCGRILDAQYFGVPQRRRRVFVVGHLGGQWQRPFAVLFDSKALSGDCPPLRKKGQRTAADIAPCLTGSGRVRSLGESRGQDAVIAIPFDTTQITSDKNWSNPKPGDPCHPLAHAAHPPAIAIAPDVSPALKARDYKGPSSDGDGDGAPILPVCFQPSIARDRGSVSDETAPTITNESDRGDSHPCIAIQEVSKRQSGTPMNGVGYSGPDDPMFTLQASAQHAVLYKWKVRKLTPLECERLQGLPENYTKIPYRGKPAEKCPDGPRYKAIGNSMAEPNVRWILERLEFVDSIP